MSTNLNPQNVHKSKYLNIQHPKPDSHKLSPFRSIYFKTLPIPRNETLQASTPNDERYRKYETTGRILTSLHIGRVNNTQPVEPIVRELGVCRRVPWKFQRGASAVKPSPPPAASPRVVNVSRSACFGPQNGHFRQKWP